ncbi:MAG: hypothetical protein P0116_16075 [Candidatus Nitrosocosmicus sp.]|nr:hypothetical protein [Candidatus Nitrosocosmicus sp.]
MNPFSFVIFKDRTYYKAKNTTTGAIQFTNPNPSIVFNSVITAMNISGGGIAGIRNGLYPIDDNPIILKHFTGFVGEDQEKTILRSHLTNDTIFRYWHGASSTPLEDFTLSNLKIELNNRNGNGTGHSESAWISSGTKNCRMSNLWLKSFSEPAIPTIGFFLDTAQNTNCNQSLIVQNCRFEGPLMGQDMLGCGNLVDCDFSRNEFRNCTAQAIGVGASFHSIISNNRFVNVGNAIGYESLCENNLISDNVLYNTSGIKLSGGWEKNSIHISRNNKCVNNHFSYGDGGIEAAISIDDEISGNKFYRTRRNGIQGSFLRTVLDNNIFTDTNYGNHSDRLLGNHTLQRTGGIIAYNSNTALIPMNEWNSFVNNTFHRSGIKFPVNDLQVQGYTNGLVIDTKYLNSFVYLIKGNIGKDLIRNFGTRANIS